MKFKLIVFLVFALYINIFARTVSLNSYNTSVPSYEIQEFDIQVTDPVTGNPFTEAQVSAVVNTPQGNITIQGFCDSVDGTLFKVRFAPMVTGNHTFTISFTDTMGTETMNGNFSVTSGTAKGFIHTDTEYPTYFKFSNGGHPFICSKTAWLIAGIPESNQHAFLDKMIPRGENCIRFGLEFDYSHSEPYIDVWPFAQPREAEDYSSFDIEFWRNLDDLLTYAGDRDIYSEIVLFTLMGLDMPWEDMQHLIDYLLARTACSPSIIMYQLVNENDNNYQLQTQMADYIHNNDPYGHLVSTSHGTSLDAAWPTAPWMDVAINHSCTPDDQLYSRYYTIANQISGYNKPGWCDETGRENRHGNDDGVHRRKQYWTWNMGGAFWNYHSWEGSEGIMDVSYDGPGSEYLQYIKPFWESFEFWRMRPDNSIIRNNPPVQYEWAMKSEDEVVVYLVNETTGASSPEGTIELNLPAGHTYVAVFMDPADGSINDEYHQSRLEGGSTVSITYPPFTDDLVLHCYISNDHQAPQISNISSSQVTAYNARIDWNSDEPTDARIKFGLNDNYGRKTLYFSKLEQSHSILLQNLMPGTEYHYQVISGDLSGNITTSQDYSFTTPPVSISPAINSFSPAEGNLTTRVTIHGDHLLGTHTSPIRIMPLGQSETRGVTGSTDSSGYRNDLTQKLLDNGFAFHFTGNESDGTGFDALHEGHDNLGTEQLAQNVAGYITNWSPEYMLVYTGPHDLNNGQSPSQVISEITSLVDNIHNQDENIIILLGTLIPRSDGLLSNTTQLNSLISDLVNTKQAEGKAIYLADHYNTFINNTSWASQYMSTSSQPNNAGYAVMADTWYNSMQNAWANELDMAITFNGITAEIIQIISEDQVMGHVPAGAMTGKIGIDAEHGTAASTSSFIINPVDSKFTSNTTSGYAPLLVRFTNTTEGALLGQNWDFGDGTPNSQEENPWHVYTKAGTYTVTLTIEDMVGTDTETKTNYITVQERNNTPIPPKWVYKPWVWEDGVNTEARIRSIVQGYLDNDIPVGAVNLDSPWSTDYNTFEFDPVTYPNGADMINDFHDEGIKVIAWITPLINSRSLSDPNSGHASNYDYAKDNGYFIDDGQLYQWWKGWGSFIDYTNPYALKWWHDQMDKVLDLGLDGWKTDAGNKNFPYSAQGYHGEITKEEYSKLYYQDFYEYTKASRGEHTILFSKPYDETLADTMFVPRAYTPTAFVGDQLHDWSNMGLLNALGNVFRSAEDDFVAVGSDIGGFMGEMDIEKNLLIRWTQFGAMCPIMENGGHGDHLPWQYDQQTIDIYRYFAKLHTQLAPYFYSYGVVAHNGGRGILRPANGNWQYTLGNEIFVSAMYQNTTSRVVELPSSSKWIDYWNDDTVYQSGQVLNNYDCPIHRYPIFIKSGAIIPMQVEDNETGHGSTASENKLTVLVYPDGNSQYVFYDESHTTTFACQEDNDVVQLNVSSAADNYIFRIKYPVGPAAVALNSGNLAERATFAEFESAATGWYFDQDKHYAWIKTGPQSGLFNISLSPETTANFTASPLSGEPPLTVQFTDHSVYATSWDWDFGDGSSHAVIPNPQHVYNNPGMYTVTLTVTGASGTDTITKQNYIRAGSLNQAFVDITQQAGMGLASASGSQSACFTDINNDGRYDLFVANAGDNYYYDFMYINQNGTSFQQNSAARGTDDPNHTYCIINADFDNDGDLDAFYANQPVGNNSSVARNRLYQNDGNGYYTDITNQAGIASEYEYSRGALAADFNGDGWLDLFVVNWGAQNVLYFNDGTGKMVRVHKGTDDDDSAKLSVTAADIDNDNDIDLYVCRTENPNRLYINNGSGVFSEQAAARGVALDHRSKGATFADVDNDGDLDLFVAKYKLSSGDVPQVGIYFNRGDGTFHDRSADYNITSSLYSILLVDADNDTDVDMFLIRNSEREADARPELFLNDGSGQFIYQPFPGLEVAALAARGAAYADIDRDGDVDLFIACTNGRNYLFRNDLELTNHYIDVLVKGRGGDYGGMGSKVQIYQPGHLGSKYHQLGYQHSISNMGSMSQNQTALHFGLDGFNTCDIRVTLTDGTVLDYHSINTDQVFVAEYSETIQPDPPVVHTPQPSGNHNLLLSWNEVAGAEAYHIYRDVTPWFEPDMQGGSNRIMSNVTDQDPATAGIQWTDTDQVTGNHEINYYYTITSVRNGTESIASDQIGVFDYKLITTPSTDFNEVALPLNNPALSNASDLQNAIPGCTSIARWSATMQGFEQYISIIPATDFELTPGHPYYVNVNDTSMLSLAGKLVSVNFELVTTPTTDFNEIMLPLEKTEITKASQLQQDIPGCTSVARWDASIQGYEQYISVLPFTDFDTAVGYAYYVNITENVTWPAGSMGKTAPAQSPAITVTGPVKSPHAVYGNLVIPGDITDIYFTAHIRDQAEQILHSGTGSSKIVNDKWVVQTSAFTDGWQAGDVLCVNFYTQNNVLIGSVEQTLTWDPVDQAGQVTLEKVATDYILHQNYPNPFNPKTTIRFGLPKPGNVSLVITDITGRRVKTLVDGNCEAGYHRVVWTGVADTGLSVASGVYFYTLKTDGKVFRKKLLLIR